MTWHLVAHGELKPAHCPPIAPPRAKGARGASARWSMGPLTWSKPLLKSSHFNVTAVYTGQGPPDIECTDQRLPLWSFMKTKLKVISSKIRKSVRKLMPQPCRAFSSRARLELGRKAWRSKLELE